MRKIIVMLFVLTTPLIAQVGYADRGQVSEIKKVREAFSYLSVHDPSWLVFVVSQEEWEKPLSKHQLEIFAGACYTFRIERTTWCNAQWVDHSDLALIGRILAHERAHIDCDCVEEWKAEALAISIFRP